MNIIKHIYIIGTSFVNKGAEAMAITAIRNFHRIYPNCQITIASSARTETRKYGGHEIVDDDNHSVLTFELVRNPKKISHIFKVIAWLFFPFKNIRNWFLKHDIHLQRFSKADLIVDLSGFAMSDQRSLVRKLEYCFEIFTSICLRKPFVILTQDMGPFRKVSSRLLAKLFLPHTAMLVARAESTRTFLDEIGIAKKMQIPVCSDTAFLFKSTNQEQQAAKKLLSQTVDSGESLVGIIPNINIFYRSQEDGQQYIQWLAKTYQWIEKLDHCRPVFICHEHSLHRKDDYWIVQQAIQTLHRPEPILVIKGDNSAGVLKAVISETDLIIASRFHSVVAAISTATPFLAVGWAHKYIELCRSVGMEDAAFSFDQLSDNDFLSVLKQAWHQREQTKSKLHQAVPILMNSARSAYELIEKKWPGAKDD
ncbi:MAG: polysaccharide pyruvyl transferase family protein [Planctomycetota bacterium]|jgi:polysaccharide pyruvyl transferase WcaK-like protein